MFTRWTISPELFTWIRNNLPDGRTILELGSGDGTAELLKHYKVYSVESDSEWLDRTASNYIYAPIITYGNYEWFDISKLQSLPEYDLLLVDAPNGNIGRKGLLKHLDLFDMLIPTIIDDTHRRAEHQIAVELSKIYKMNVEYTTKDGRRFTILWG